MAVSVPHGPLFMKLPSSILALTKPPRIDNITFLGIAKLPRAPALQRRKGGPASVPAPTGHIVHSAFHPVPYLHGILTTEGYKTRQPLSRLTLDGLDPRNAFRLWRPKWTMKGGQIWPTTRKQTSHSTLDIDSWLRRGNKHEKAELLA